MGEFIIRRLFKYSSWLLNLIERPLIKRYSANKMRHAPTFIIGPPRTGSTILYQALTQKLDVLYIDNLINMARNNPYIGFWFSQKIFGNKSHNSSSSNHGNTKGLHAPNEGLFWYKWLPRDRHYIELDEMNTQSIGQIKELLQAITNRYDKPILFKNLSFSVRLPFVKTTFPEAKIIYIKRNPLYVAQSILLGKRKSNTPANEVWSIKPKEHALLAQMDDELEQIVWQIYLIEKQIHKDLRLFEEQQVNVIDYEALNETIIEHLSKHIDCTKRAFADSIEINISNNQRLDDATFVKIKNYIEQLDWENHTSNLSMQ
ncbi:sulfotransferase [Carboxylicivirga marina]|uniref:Sulfotransferase n=1 Tax=Carboxylicivirga marina TaxID=2800988 RepID=A0ABS1HLK4_9BACT|nr:sulfotransferase [Carboxylicivirga marina]MBK3518559.1 sulfotransferase [Carboxylicivirga marina]